MILKNIPGGTFIQGGTFIKESRVPLRLFQRLEYTLAVNGPQLTSLNEILCILVDLKAAKLPENKI